MFWTVKNLLKTWSNNFTGKPLPQIWVTRFSQHKNYELITWIEFRNAATLINTRSWLGTPNRLNDHSASSSAGPIDGRWTHFANSASFVLPHRCHTATVWRVRGSSSKILGSGLVCVGTQLPTRSGSCVSGPWESICKVDRKWDINSWFRSRSLTTLFWRRGMLHSLVAFSLAFHNCCTLKSCVENGFMT